MLEDPSTMGSTGVAGNMITQLFGNISMMACTMLANPHQPECLACRGLIHSSPIMLEVHCCTEGICYKGSLGSERNVLFQLVLYLA